MSAYGVVAAWALILVVLAFLAQTAIGARLIYGLLVLAILFLLVTQYQAIATLLAPIGTPPA